MIYSIEKTCSFLFKVVMAFVFIVVIVSCAKDDEVDADGQQPEYEIEEYVIPTEDVMSVTSELASYVFPYEYNNFGDALVRRLKNTVTTINEDNFYTISSVVIHDSQIESMIDELPLILAQLMMGKNIIIIEPTLENFSLFCDLVTAVYMQFIETDEGQELLEEMDIIPDARQTLEAFYEMSNNPSNLDDLFLSNTDSAGVFAEAIAVRGCNFHIVERINEDGIVEVTDEQVNQQTGEVAISTDFQDEPNDGEESSNISSYTYGLFADMFTKWINEQPEYEYEVEAMRKRGAHMLNTRGESTTKFNLDDICTVQKVEYTIEASIPEEVSSPLPVTVSFEICAVYMEKDDSDYYCVYKNIVSYNQLLDCGPTDELKWRTKEGFGEVHKYSTGQVKVELHKFYGPFMRDLSSQSICHSESDFVTESDNEVVELPNANSITKHPGVRVEKYSPMNSIGSVDQTSGFSYGFDGGLYMGADPSVNLGFSVSYDSSTTQSIDNLEIVASTLEGVPTWKYKGNNLPIAKVGFFRNYHTFAPSIMRQQCEVDQSWIWRVPNPSGSYRIFDETSITTCLHYATNYLVYNADHYRNSKTTKRVSFRMAPPPRCEQLWVANVTPYSEEVNTMLSTTHSRFWNKDNHEFSIADNSEESRITINQFIDDFKRDLENKKKSWSSRGFKGPYTFNFYMVGSEDSDITFVFNVE